MAKQAIFVIVPGGKAETVIQAAESAGSSGGTIIHARGRGEVARSFLAIEVEPEREIVMIIAEEAEIAKISKAIYREMDLNIRGQGLLFVLPLARVEGLASLSAD
jgi:nitrogen regulatory protein PII